MFTTVDYKGLTTHSRFFIPLRMATMPVNVNASRTSSDLIRTDFWFDDGNVILIAGSAAFKVHRGQLQRHSEFFNGLLSLPWPQEQSLIDDCIWVELYDRPSDVLYFLKALYDGLFVYFKHDAEDFAAVAAVLRLSTKYFVEHLRQRCLARLDLDWPSTLGGWDQREAAATDERGYYLPHLTSAHPVLAVCLALELGIYPVLCSAMYDVSRYGPSRIKIGARPPGLACELVLNPELDVEAYNGRYVTLPPEILYRTLKGREDAQKYVASFVEKEIQSRAPSAECAYRMEKDNPSWQCHESFYYILLNVLRSVGGLGAGRDADPLFTLLHAGEMVNRTDFSDGEKMWGLKMCEACKADFARSVVKAREEVWALLPAWFGLSFVREPAGADVNPGNT